MSSPYLKLEQWRSLIEQQKVSDESVTRFCQCHDLITKTFWNRRKTLRELEQGNGLMVVAPQVSSATSRPLSIRWPSVELVLADQASATWMKTHVRTHMWTLGQLRKL